MNPRFVMIGSLVLGGAAGFAASRIGAADAPPASAPAPISAPAVPASVTRELERIERRIDDLSTAARTRQSAQPSRPAEADAAPAASSADPSIADRLTAVEKRLSALERSGGAQGPKVPDSLTGVATKELDALARSLVQQKRFDEAQRVLKEVLGRTDLDEEQRTEMELQVGYALRGAGRNADAEARFLETLRRVGEDSEKGAWVGFQVGWERYYQKDLAGASARMERSADATGVTPIVRVHALYNAANFAKQGGDTARARTLLERLLNNHAGDIPESQASMKTQAEAWLKEIRGN